MVKVSPVIQFGILAAVSGVIAGLTFVTGRIVASHWHEMLAGVRLPGVTVFATQHGYLIPLCCSLAAIAGALVAAKKAIDPNHLWVFFTLIACFELIGMALLSAWHILPSLNIMYRMGGG